MGFENRDYVRDGSFSRGGTTFMADAPVCKRILIVTVVVFLAQMVFTRQANVEDYKARIEQQMAQRQQFDGRPGQSDRA